jgi:ribonuclease VapC
VDAAGASADAVDQLGGLELAIGAPTLVESAIVMVGANGADGMAALLTFVREFDVVVIPFEQKHAGAAADAFFGFGKGRHRAALNYGDCMTYATAKRAGRPLLFIGDDFVQTDIQAA